MADDKPEISETERVQIHKIHAVSEATTKIISELAKWGVLGFCVYWTGDVLKVYAGQVTFADVTFSWLMSEKLAGTLGLIFGAGGIVYGRQQARLRRDVIERMHPYQVEHEKSKDPDRSSSGLTERGETQLEDL